jgi:DNA-directed RNA polymerase subunit M/transcription elongation factor TFIIS
MDSFATVTALLSAFDVVKAAIAARDDHKVAEAEQRLTRVLVDVQSVCLGLQQKVQASIQTEAADKHPTREMEGKILELEQRAIDRSRYALTTLSEGVYALASKEDTDSSEPKHYLCQPCMDNRRKEATLQRTVELLTIFLTCPECGYKYPTGWAILGSL